MRSYILPEKRPDESNGAWCERAAASIPAEELMKEVVAYLMRDSRKYGKGPDARFGRAWLFLSRATGHGSGVSAEIVRRFMPRGEGGD